MNTNNGQQGWYIDFLPLIINGLNARQPSLSIAKSGIMDLDGSYWVNVDDGNLAIVSKTKKYSIYFSNSSSVPDCKGNKNVDALSKNFDPFVVSNPNNGSFSLHLGNGITNEKGLSYIFYD